MEPGCSRSLEADHSAIEQSRAEAAELGGIEFEEFFDELLQDRD